MLVWVGKRESDIFFSKYMFNYSITYWGSNIDKNTSLNVTHDNLIYGSGEYLDIVAQRMFDILLQFDNAQFLFYNNSQAKQIAKKYPKLLNSIVGYNTVCHEWLRQKSLFRIWASNYCLVPPTIMLASEQCKYEYLKRVFPSYSSYVIQADLSSGGEKTYIVTKNDKLHFVDKGRLYLISPYLSGNSYNAHVLITQHQVVVLSISLQLIYQSGQNLLFIGGDYSSCKLTTELKSNIISMCKSMGEVLQLNGYRGILGLDFISDDTKTYVIESNPRFQGSSLLLDQELNKCLKCSLFDLHIKSFDGNTILDEKLFPLDNMGSCLYPIRVNNSMISRIPTATYTIKSANFHVEIFDGSLYDWMQTS